MGHQVLVVCACSDGVNCQAQRQVDAASNQEEQVERLRRRLDVIAKLAKAS